jgi:signal transduction histidine kinase
VLIPPNPLRLPTVESPDTRDAAESGGGVVAFTTDVEGRVHMWSAEAEALFGYTSAAIEQQSWNVLLATDLQPASQSAPHAHVASVRVRRFRRRDRSEFEGHHAMVPFTREGVVAHSHVVIGIEGGTPRPDSAELRYSEQARLHLLRRLVIAQEEERRRIARDLHDHLGQELTALRLKFEVVRSLTADLPEIHATLQQADALLSRIDSDIDFLSWELRPAALYDLGLQAVLENYVSEWSRHSAVPARFHAERMADIRVAPEIEATLYRIAQEALNNVARHAHARSVNVVLEGRERSLSLAIEDDGVGFDPSTMSNTMIGLVGMRERAAVVGGSLDIEPTPGGGTTVLARVPLSLTEPFPLLDVGARDAPDLPSHNHQVTGGAAASSGRIAELQRAVAARDDFIATVAHELRNPIAPLTFQIRLSIDKAKQMEAAGVAVSAEWTRVQLHQIEQRLHRLLTTLDRLLDVSRLSTGRIDLELDTVDLAEIARDVVSSFEAEIAIARCETTVVASATVLGSWDRLRLDQICRNLVSNAIRFGAGRPIQVIVEADDNNATLIVRDYGIGIPRQKQGLIFDRFERGPQASRSGGFGIGLWVVRNLCAAMGGSIKVESSVGEGSTFAVTLPRRPDRDQRREESE